MLAAEQVVLGCLMWDASTWSIVSGKLSANDFASRRHQLVFAAIRELAVNQQEFDALSVSYQVDANDELQNCGGAEYIFRLVLDTASTANLSSFVENIREASRKRRIRAAALRLIDGDDFEVDLTQLRTALEAA